LAAQGGNKNCRSEREGDVQKNVVIIERGQVSLTAKEKYYPRKKKMTNQSAHEPTATRIDEKVDASFKMRFYSGRLIPPA
jgi:hypothetical protein